MNKDLKNIIIVATVSLGIVGLLKLIFKNKKTNPDSDSDSKIDYIMNNKINKVGTMIVSTPETKLESYPLIIVFGGISFATPDWMLSQIPDDILYKAIVVIVPYTTSYETAKSESNKFLSNNRYKTSSTSIIGFSAGGMNVQKSYDKDFKFVGLIDPSTRPEYASISFGKNANIVYNDSNWGGYPLIKSLLPKLGKKISSLGGNNEKVSIKHADVPKYFFDKFKNELV